MAKIYSISDVANIAINKAADVTEEIIDAGRKFYCNLHQNHPAWTVARAFSDRSIILRAIDQMCQGPGYTPVPEPQPEFTGGQCCDQTYLVYANSNLKRCFDGLTVSFASNKEIEVTGKVLGISLGQLPTNPGLRGTYITAEFCNGVRSYYEVVSSTRGISNDGCVTSQPPNTSVPDSYDRANSTFSIGSIVTLDGSPDNCGDPPADFPPEPDPTDLDLTGTVSVTNINNESYDYNVTVNRDTNNTIEFPATIVVNDVTMTMDITGITVINNNNTQKPSGGGSGGVAEEEPVEPQDKNAGKELSVQPGAIEEDVPNIYAVIVDITNIPVNAKVSSGFGAPDKIFPGWIEFKVGSDYLPRQFIDFENSYFFAPEDATGYAITILTGYSASIFKAFFVEV